jgi:phage shock protein A
MAEQDDVTKGFVRLELLIQQLGRDMERRMVPLEATVRTIGTEVATLRSRYAALEERIGHVQETAHGAMRKAEDSVTEVQSMGTGLINHIDRTEKARVEASKAHAKRFDAHHDSLRKQAEAIGSLQRNINHRGQTSTILMIVSMVLIPAITASAIALIQELKTTKLMEVRP